MAERDEDPAEPAESDGDRPAVDDLPGVGDPRQKHVTVVTRAGKRREHGDVYLRHTTDAFVVSPDPEFPGSETTWYRKEDLSRVEVTQHHAACFITTATAGEGQTLDALRNFRDDAMARSTPGRALVRLYYAISPPVAETLSRHPDAWTARVVRWLVVKCAALARRRGSTERAPLRMLLSVTLTLLYVVGLAVAITGHLGIRVRERVTAE